MNDYDGIPNSRLRQVRPNRVPIQRATAAILLPRSVVATAANINRDNTVSNADAEETVVQSDA